MTDAKSANEALAANAFMYDDMDVRAYIAGAPHLRHDSLRQLYETLAERVFVRASIIHATPSVLDLGAGEGLVTLPFLQRGARVTAVDISARQLMDLKQRCTAYESMLRTIQGDVNDALDRALANHEHYDVVVANSFLHHVPDYVGLLRKATKILNAGGVIFTFQDPLRYQTLRMTTRSFATGAYLLWRIRQGDIFYGTLRRLRRIVGIYHADDPADNMEYHVVREGVDQDAVAQVLQQSGLQVDMIRYFSTQDAPFQALGEHLGMTNMFAIVATKS